MDNFTVSMEVRWADLDPNFHVRHSVYYDWGASARMRYLESVGLTPNVMTEAQFGPILFREECTFRREIRFGDIVTIDVCLLRTRADYSRWSMQHRIFRNGELAAMLIVDGAWIDTNLRKLTIPAAVGVVAFEEMPKAEGFEIN